MKVILLKDVPRIGRKYEVKDVPDGHALNFLIPRKLGERATPDSLRRLEIMKSKSAVAHAESEHAFRVAVAKAAEAGATISVEANAEGGLYKAVHADDIVKAFTEKGIVLEERSILIDMPIKTVGQHEIKLASGSYEGAVTITVLAA